MIRVLVFPSSNEPGLEIIRSLLDQPGIEVHAASCFEPHEDASASLVRRRTRLPELGEEAFRSSLENYVRRERIDVVFPTMERMVSELSHWRLPGVRFMTQSPEVAEIVESKQRTYEALTGIVPVPETYASGMPPLPAYAKPTAGSGGRGHQLIRDENDLQRARDAGLLVTEYLPGNEIVAYNLSDFAGNHLLTITKTMGRWRGGASQLGALRDDPVVRGYAQAIAERLRLVGPWFAQFKQDRLGNYKLMEVNARPGGAIGICRHAGVNIPLLAVRLLAGDPVEIPSVPSTGDLTWVRNLRPFLTMPEVTRVLWSPEALCRPADGSIRPPSVAALFDLANRGISQWLVGRLPPLLEKWCIGRHFAETFADLDQARKQWSNPARTVLVADDESVRLRARTLSPELRMLTSDTLDALGQETR